MAIEEVQVQYRTGDGRKFTDKREAERHEKLHTAWETYEQARRLLGKCIAETERTADGFLFEFGTFSGYWYVWDRWDGLPSLVEVDFLGWNIHWEGEADSFQLKGALGNRGDHLFRISELYRRKENAERALLKAQEEWLAEQSARVAKLRAKVILAVSEE